MNVKEGFTMARRKNVVRRRRKAKRGFASWVWWKKTLAIVGGTVVLLTTAGVALAASKLGKIETTELDASKLNISTEVDYNETGYLNVALFGLDTRENDVEQGERSDTIIIASLNRETKDVKLCSVFRDTLLQQEDGSYNKANSAYSYGGAEEAVAMLNKNLDLDIQHYATVNFSALIDVVDALGGIELDLTSEEVFWTNGYATETSKVTGNEKVELTTPGVQVVDGVQAVSYCRIRKTTGDDFKRAERQRTVLEQIMKKAQSADLSSINKIIDKVFPDISTNFTLTEILAYAKDAFNYKLTDMDGFPFENSTPNLSGVGSCVVPETLLSNVQQLHQFLFGADGYSPSTIVTTISSEVAGSASNTISDEEAATYEPVENNYSYSYDSGGSSGETTGDTSGGTGTGSDVGGVNNGTSGTDTPAGGADTGSDTSSGTEDGSGAVQQDNGTE